MKTKRIFLLSIRLFMLIGLAACTDHLLVPTTPGSTPGRLRLKSITEDLPDRPQKVNLLRYDGQNRLSSVVTYQSPDSSVAPVNYTMYRYDSLNRLMRIGYYAYQHNAAGQVERVNHPDGYSETLRYNSSNQLTGSSGSKFVQFVSSHTDSYGYTFTGNNLTSLEEHRSGDFRGASYRDNSTTLFTHDDKPNPFYGLYLIPTFYGGLGSKIFYLSQNNVLTSRTTTTYIGSPNAPTSKENSYQYTYNAADLPITRQTIINGTVTGTLRFEYESY